MELQSFDEWAEHLWCKTFVLIFACSFFVNLYGEVTDLADQISFHIY